jgi:hypothetical protein
MAQRNDHIRAEELFSAYIDHHITAGEQQFVERHVAQCADCRVKLEATRATVTALHNLPAVKAPRSFVLPRSMERQARPSIVAWYPALRLATVFAVIAFVIVFAGDLLTLRGGALNVATAPLAAPAPAMATAPAVAMQPIEPPAAAPQSAPAQAQPKETSGAAQSSLPTIVAPMSETYSTATATLPVTTTNPVTVNLPIVVAAAPTVEAPREATPEAFVATSPSADQTTPTAGAEAQTAPLDPLRAVEIALAGLAIILLVATLITRRHAA